MNRRLGSFLATALVALSSISLGQFTSKGARLYSQIPLSAMPGAPGTGAGCTGFVSSNGREYGIMGVANGTVIVDITNPYSPELLTHIPGLNSLWHENAVL